MDRIVNVRMNADLAQAIQQFTQLNQVITQLGTNMSGLGLGAGVGGGFGGGGGIPIGGLGGGAGAPGGGGGVVAQVAGNAPARRQNRAPAPPSPATGGGYTHPGITSQMFGLAQIGFAMEDYQYAGWRGVMNNVPWIANALGNMAGGMLGIPGLGQAALLGTAVGVPLANAAYESLSPETLNSISQLFGGVSMSSSELRGARATRLESRISRMSDLDYRRSDLERELVKMRLNEGAAQEGAAYFYTPYQKPVSDVAKQGVEAGLSEFQKFGGGEAIADAFKRANEQDLKKRSEDFSGRYYDSTNPLISYPSTLAHIGWQMGGALKDVATQGGSYGDKLSSRLRSWAEVGANQETQQAFEETKQKVGEAIKSGDKQKLQDAAKLPYLPLDVRVELSRLIKMVNEGEKRAREQAVIDEEETPQEAASRAAEQSREEYRGKLQQDADFKLQDMRREVDESRRLGGMAADRYSSQIEAIVSGSKTGGDAAAGVEEFLRSQGVSEDKIGATVTQEFQQGVQDAKDNKLKSDDELWNEHSAQWIAAVKSDILQAQGASWQNGKYNGRVFATYSSRIQQRIIDDLGRVGITRANRQRYAKMIWDAAYQEAAEQYTKAQERGVAQMESAGVRPGRINAGMANMAAMQNLAGEMSDDLTAVYGVAASHTFAMQRMYDQQIRRRQIMMSRFQR